MNKTQLVDALAARIGDRRTAANAVDGLLETIVDTVKGGDQVSITGFGVFEARDRAARVARNPRTGDTVDVPATTVPAFRPGAGFRTAVSGAVSTPAPRTAPVRRTRAAAAAAEPAAPAKPARRAAKAKPDASFAAAPAAKTTTKPAAKPAAKAPAKAAPAKATAAKAAPKAAAKAPAKAKAAKAKDEKPKRSAKK
jgi:DNA-binding protein HU-beta